MCLRFFVQRCEDIWTPWPPAWFSLTGFKIYYSLLFLGIVAAGGIFTGTNPSYTKFELAHHIKTAHVRFIVTEPELLSNIQEAARDSQIPQSRIWIFNVHGQSVPSGFKSWWDLTEHGESDWIRFNDRSMSIRTPAAFIFSSGTTGLPKAAVYSHYNLLAQHTLAIEPEKVPYEVLHPHNACLLRTQ